VNVVPGIKLVDDNNADSSHAHAREGHLGQGYKQLSECSLQSSLIKPMSLQKHSCIVQGGKFLVIENILFVACDKFKLS
jgi:hypothetical protein